MHVEEHIDDRWRRRLSVLAVGGLAIAWCLFAFMPGQSTASPALERSAVEVGVSRGPDGVPALGQATVAETTSPLLLREEAPADTIVLCVRSTEGDPLPGAVVARCPASGARNLSPADRLGLTNSLGEISFPVASNSVAEAGSLVASARGFVPATIKCPEAPGHYEVRLGVGSTVEIECRDYSSTPLHGVRISISKVIFSASIWRDTPRDRREAGSDPTSTIWHDITDKEGRVAFSGILPGQYYVRAESDTHQLAAVVNSQKTMLDVGQGVSQHVILCGIVCVAALQTTVRPSEILDYQIASCPSHVHTAFVQDALDLYRRDVESRFPHCQVLVAVAGDHSGGLGHAKFSYRTLGHGDFSCDVLFVRIDKFQEPEVFVAPEVARPATGEVVLKVEGDHGVSRRKLRAELKRSMRSLEGIICVEGEPRVVPVGQYVIDCHDRELVTALDIPVVVDVAAGSRQEVVMRIRDGLVPVVINIAAPTVLVGQYCFLEIKGFDQVHHKRRTKGGSLIAWLASGVYELTVKMNGCKPITTSLVVSIASAGPTSLVLEAVQ